jgi:hypothetical protein
MKAGIARLAEISRPLLSWCTMARLRRIGCRIQTILYNIKAIRRPPFVGRSRVFEIGERALYDRAISRAVGTAEVARVAIALANTGNRRGGEGVPVRYRTKVRRKAIPLETYHLHS